MQNNTGISTWHLDVDELKAYRGISAEVFKEEQAHKLRMEELEKLASGYKPQNF